MKDIREIEPKDSKFRYHGYQEWYYIFCDELFRRGTCKNGLWIGYNELHLDKSNIDDIGQVFFYIK